MKVKEEHYNHIKVAIEQVGADALRRHREALKDDPRVRDLEKRLRWDALHAVIPSRWVCDNLYPYVNDDHIDTALRRVMKEMGV